MVACASTGDTPPSPKTNAPDIPGWTNNAPAGCGVGIARFRGDTNVARTTAISRARADLAGSLETRVKAMIKDYQSQGEDTGKEFTEERVVQVSSQLTDQSLSGTRTVDSFMTNVEPRDFYSLVCVDAKSFGELVQQMNSLSQTARDALKKRAEAEFHDMDQQLDKSKGE
jgi:hypothetical protein